MNETDQPAPAITLNWPEPPPGYKLLCKYVSLTKATSARMFFPRDGGWDDERMRYPSLKASYIDNYWLAVKETDEPADAPAKDAGETPRVVGKFIEARKDPEFVATVNAIRSSETPRTDAEAFEAEVGDWGKGEFVAAAFARTLEREAAALREENDRLIELAREADFVKDQRDAYLSDLEEIGKIIGCGHIAEGLARCVRERIEEAALADGKGDKPCGQG